MKVELIIADDKELRAAINELIRGEVLNVARKDIKEIIASAVDNRLPNDVAATQTMERLFKEEIKTQVKEILGQRTNWNDPSYVQKVAREEIREYLRSLVKEGGAV